MGSPRRRRNRRRAVLPGALGLVLVAALIAVLFVLNLGRSFDTQTVKLPSAFPAETLRPVKPTAGPAAQAKNVLQPGSDSRGDSVDMAEAGAAQAKINAAMAFGGIPLVVQTLEGMFNNRIDHVAVVDFDGFKAITDTLGGVEVNVPIAFTSTHGGFTFAAGPQKLNGDQALGFVRERYAFIDGDYQRVRDQQIFLKAMLDGIMSPATLANPVKITGLVNAVSPYIRVDAGLNAATVGALAVSLNSVRGSDVAAFTLPTLGTGTSADGQSIVLKDDAAIAAISQALSNDTLGGYLSSAGLG